MKTVALEFKKSGLFWTATAPRWPFPIYKIRKRKGEEFKVYRDGNLIGGGRYRWQAEQVANEDAE